MPTLDEQIAQSLRDSLASGELRAAPSWGKPLALDDGWDETPVELRLPFRILKEAGYVPQEVLQLHECAQLRSAIAACSDEAEALPLRRRLADLQQIVALRLERLRVTGTL
ncbi:MAG: DUF1992 domain-containing protein [Piscinibacter sp.]|nr:DUF1992 domain-containing protein [Piscinibacter sp.]